MKLKKTIILVSILIIPILFYIFLRIFGKNQYSLPLYDSENISFYREYLDSLQIQWQHKKTLLYIPPSTLPKQEAEKNEILRLLDSTEKDSAFQIVISHLDSSFYFLSHKRKVFFTQKKILSFPEMEGLEMDFSHGKALLIDRKGNVRGIYSLETQGEIERIAVELSILENN